MVLGHSITWIIIRRLLRFEIINNGRKKRAPSLCHLKEKKILQLPDVVAIAHVVVAKDVSVVSEFLNDDEGAHFRNSNLSTCTTILRSP